MKKTCVIRYILLGICLFFFLSFMWIIYSDKDAKEMMEDAPLISADQEIPEELIDKVVIFHGILKGNEVVSDAPWTGNDEFIYLVKDYIYDSSRTEKKSEENSSSFRKARLVHREVKKSEIIKLGRYELEIDLELDKNDIPFLHEYYVSEENQTINDWYNGKSYLPDQRREIDQDRYTFYQGLLNNKKYYVVAKINRNKIMKLHEFGGFMTEDHYDAYTSGLYSRMTKITAAIQVFFIVQLITSIIQTKVYGRSCLISIMRFMMSIIIAVLFTNLM